MPKFKRNYLVYFLIYILISVNCNSKVGSEFLRPTETDLLAGYLRKPQLPSIKPKLSFSKVDGGRISPWEKVAIDQQFMSSRAAIN